MGIKYFFLDELGEYWGFFGKYPTIYDEDKYIFFDPVSLLPLNDFPRSRLTGKIMKELGIINPKSSRIKWAALTENFFLLSRMSQYGIYSLDLYSRKTRKKILKLSNMAFRPPVFFKNNIILRQILKDPFLVSISLDFLKELEKNDKVTEYKYKFDPNVKGILGVENATIFRFNKVFSYKDGLYVRSRASLLRFKTLSDDLAQIQPEIIYNEKIDLDTLRFHLFENFFAEYSIYGNHQIILTDLDTNETFIHDLNGKKTYYKGMCIGHGYLFLFDNGLVEIRDMYDFSLKTEFRLIFDKWYYTRHKKSLYEGPLLSFCDPYWVGKVLYIRETLNIFDKFGYLFRIDFSRLFSKLKDSNP